jgi:uncharacterized protein (TIGR03437 family)
MQRTSGAAASEEITKIAVDSAGNVWFIGSTFSVTNMVGTNSYLLGKLDRSGSRLLVRNEAISTEGELAVDSRDNLLVVTRADGARTVSTARGAWTSACGPSQLALFDPQGVLLYAESANVPWRFTGWIAQDRAALAVRLPQRAPALPLDLSPTLWLMDLSAPPAAWLSCAVDAASLTGANAVAPGEIITLFGGGLGPVGGQQFAFDADARVPRVLAGTRVFFNGVPVPVLYSQNAQVNAIAPFALKPGTAIEVTVEYAGARLSKPMDVIASRPAIFVRESLPYRDAAALNEDGTVNSSRNPARPGSVVTLFLTGTGSTIPPLVERELARAVGPVPEGGFAITFGADILTPEYIGVSPGSLTSLTQVNVRLPSPLPEWVVDRGSISVLVDGEPVSPAAYISVQRPARR